MSVYRRYHVNETFGWVIDPKMWESTKTPSTSYTIVDDAYSRTVAFFDPRYQGSTPNLRAKVYAICAEMNRDERDWELGRGKYAA